MRRNIPLLQISILWVMKHFFVSGLSSEGEEERFGIGEGNMAVNTTAEEDVAPFPHALSKTGSSHQAGTSPSSTQSPSHHPFQGVFPALDSDLLCVSMRTEGESSPESPLLASKRSPNISSNVRGISAGGEREGGRARPRSAGVSSNGRELIAH